MLPKATKLSTNELAVLKLSFIKANQVVLPLSRRNNKMLAVGVVMGQLMVTSVGLVCTEALRATAASALVWARMSSGVSKKRKKKERNVRINRNELVIKANPENRMPGKIKHCLVKYQDRIY